MNLRRVLRGAPNNAAPPHRPHQFPTGVHVAWRSDSQSNNVRRGAGTSWGAGSSNGAGWAWALVVVFLTAAAAVVVCTSVVVRACVVVRDVDGDGTSEYLTVVVFTGIFGERSGAGSGAGAGTAKFVGPPAAGAPTGSSGPGAVDAVARAARASAWKNRMVLAALPCVLTAAKRAQPNSSNFRCGCGVGTRVLEYQLASERGHVCTCARTYVRTRTRVRTCT